ncbi:DUF6730 family protein [Gelidibacter gilvus]|uniref:Uncharacterized protein n=1 Tax=Gelidibacter gilvus TaxID=59602 RepID=A0A4Q0XCN7_9FLAO|nr:DUF6730 family protein [Gelidibacter gilvus]RXJ45595.1 hypothetical protein ESZ48_15390 [Gelidibacter gilvus]
MTKLEELTALLVNETTDFKNTLEKLEGINAQLKETKIKMDLTEYKAAIEIHQQQMEAHLKAVKNFEYRFEDTIKKAKIYPNWAVGVFIVSVILNFVLLLNFIGKFY